ncbi:MAG TPA: RimK/LysX family protein [Patescibacteria group bacterium]|nr:RimK/LysX family protein [Patescibacteria group bacterium]
MEQDKKLLGRAEKLDLVELGYAGVHCRIDTGAKTSAIWASDVEEKDNKLQVVFFGLQSPQYSGQKHIFEEFDKTVVASSTGHSQVRYKIRILIKIKGKKIRAWFTLADRSTQVYPVLIGRNVLLGKFVVDVKKGHTLKEQEQERTKLLQTKLEETEEE